MSKSLLRWILLLILILILILLVLRGCGSNDGGAPSPEPEPANAAPEARNDDLAGCTLAAAGGLLTCTLDAPAGTLFTNNGHGADSDPDGDAFTSAGAGTDVVGGTGDPWSPPGPEPRNCNGDFLCTTDRNFDAGASSLTIRPDGGFTLVYATGEPPFGTLVAEFLYVLEDGGGLTSDPAYAQVFISP